MRYLRAAAGRDRRGCVAAAPADRGRRRRAPTGWSVADCTSQIGSGALPLETLPSAGIAIAPVGPQGRAAAGSKRWSRRSAACRFRSSVTSRTARSSSICAASTTRPGSWPSCRSCRARRQASEATRCFGVAPQSPPPAVRARASTAERMAEAAEAAARAATTTPRSASGSQLAHAGVGARPGRDRPLLRRRLGRARATSQLALEMADARRQGAATRWASACSATSISTARSGAPDRAIAEEWYARAAQAGRAPRPGHAVLDPDRRRSSQARLRPSARMGAEGRRAGRRRVHDPARPALPQRAGRRA